MITSLRSCRCLRRRHLARISISDMFGESSMKSGASVSSPIVRAILVQSLSSSLPCRSFCNGIRASAESRRMVISVQLMLRLKMTVGRSCLIAAERARSRARVELCVGIQAPAGQVQVVRRCRPERSAPAPKARDAHPLCTGQPAHGPSRGVPRAPSGEAGTAAGMPGR